MCRHVAFLGTPVPLSFPLVEAEHALAAQARQPRELLLGRDCRDGYGLAWYAGQAVPERRASARPMFESLEALEFTRGIEAPMGVAAVRSATGRTVPVEADCAPFVSGSYAFSHNGYLDGWPQSWRQPVAQRIAPGRRRAILGSTDSEHLFQWVLTRVDRGEGVAEAMANVVAESAMLAAELGQKAQLNFLLANGQDVWATRAGTLGRSNSLYTTSKGGTSWIASEPLFAGDWRPVGEGQLVHLDAGGAIETRELQVVAPPQ